MKKQHKPFHNPLMLELVLVALVLVLASLAVYNSAHSKSQAIKHISLIMPTPTPRPQATAFATPMATASASPTPTPTPMVTQYLTIRELGIKLPLTLTIQDLEYQYSPAASGKPAQLHFTTTSVSTAPGGSHCVATNDPLGTYDVYASDQTKLDNAGHLPLVKVGGYFIYYTHVQYACGDTPTAEAAVAALIEPLHAAVAGAKLLP